MNTTEHDDFAELEADLRALAPRAPSAGFSDRVDTETTLRARRPRHPSPGFERRVAAACGVAESRLIRFPLPRIAAGLAAALALAALLHRPDTVPATPAPALVARDTPAQAAPGAPVAPDTGVDTAATFARADDGTILPVINLGDGRAYRPTLRRRESAPASFRATPAGILPASYGGAGATLEYSPVEYE